MIIQVSSPSPKSQQILTGLLVGCDETDAKKPLVKLFTLGMICRIFTEQTWNAGITTGLHFLASQLP
jgi:hypothetical protein